MTNIYDKLQKMGEIAQYLTPHDQRYAKSMTEQLSQRHSLSSNQWYWWDKLIERGIKARERQLNPNAPNPNEIEVGSFDGVKAFLQRSPMAWPKFRFSDNGQDYRIYIAGDRSRVKGHVVLQTWLETVPGIKNKVMMGHFRGTKLILNDGLDVQPSEWLIAYLQLMAIDMMTAVKYYAEHTGHCVFCNIPLTDDRSQAAGYGQICARNHGLPWG